jgi:L-asparaginase II
MNLEGRIITAMMEKPFLRAGTVVFGLRLAAASPATVKAASSSAVIAATLEAEGSGVLRTNTCDRASTPSCSGSGEVVGFR